MSLKTVEFEIEDHAGIKAEPFPIKTKDGYIQAKWIMTMYSVTYSSVFRTKLMSLPIYSDVSLWHRFWTGIFFGMKYERIRR